MENLLVRVRRHASIHGPYTGSKTNPKNNPWIRGHQSVAPSTSMQRLSRHTDNSNSQSSVQECVVQIFPFVKRHTAIFSRFPIEDEICGNNCCSDDATSVKKSFLQVCCIWTRNFERRLLHIGATKSGLKPISGLGQERDGRFRLRKSSNGGAVE